jgi:Phosphodiester glycosidase
LKVSPALLLFVACCKPTSHSARANPSATPSLPSAAPSASGAPLTLQRLDEERLDGLKIRSGVLGPNAAWGYTELALDVTRVELRVQLKPGGARLAELLPERAWAVVNGGYFEADFKPTAWLVDDGVQLSPKSAATKGGVLALQAGAAFIGPVAELGFAPRFALQSFPLLVEGNAQMGIHRDDGRRAARTVACQVGAALHLIVLAAPRGDGPTLFEAAELLRAPSPSGFGCHRALNLDGGPSSGVWFAPHVRGKQRPPLANVGYGLSVAPR